MKTLSELRYILVNQVHESRLREEAHLTAVAAARLAVIQKHADAGESGMLTPLLDQEVLAMTLPFREAQRSILREMKETETAIKCLLDEREERFIAAIEAVANR